MNSLQLLTRKLLVKKQEIKDIKDKIHETKQVLLKNFFFIYFTCFDVKDLICSGLTLTDLKSIILTCNEKFPKENISNIQVEKDGIPTSMKIINIPKFRVCKIKYLKHKKPTTYLQYFVSCIYKKTGLSIEFLDAEFSLRLDPAFFMFKKTLDTVMFDNFRIMGLNIETK